MKFILDNFDKLFDSEVNFKKLEEIILDLAVKGKLVPQNPDDEPATVLLEKIKAEKEKLIKEKKIKKEKELEPVSEEEKPFEIPDSWEWVRLGEIGDWGSGATPSRGKVEYYINGTIPWLKTGELNDSYIEEAEEYITEIAVKETSVRLNKIDDVLMAMYGATIGKLGILKIEATTNQACCACTAFNGVYNLYLFNYLRSQRENFRKQGVGGAQPNISKQKIVEYYFPLPPLAEQKRIVEKIDSLKKIIDTLKEKAKIREKTREELKKSIMAEIEKSDSNIDLLNSLEMVFKNFDTIVKNKEDIKDIRDLILSMAVKGKLVPQNPDDEPASVLLEKIKAEKEKLIKEKKIKKDKELEPISEEEKPFEIPDNWEWVRLGEIAEINPRNNIDDELTTSFIPMKLIDDGYSNNHTSETSKWKDIKSGFTHFADNDVVIAKITPCFQNRKSAMMKDLTNGFGAGTTELYVLRSYGELILSQYILFVAKSSAFIQGGVGTYTGTAGQQRVSKSFVENYIIGLPPLAEQKRIVEKVDKLMALCDDLEKKVEKSQKEFGKMLESAVQGVTANNAN